MLVPDSKMRHPTKLKQSCLRFTKIESWTYLKYLFQTPTLTRILGMKMLQVVILLMSMTTTSSQQIASREKSTREDRQMIIRARRDLHWLIRTLWTTITKLLLVRLQRSWRRNSPIWRSLSKKPRECKPLITRPQAKSRVYGRRMIARIGESCSWIRVEILTLKLDRTIVGSKLQWKIPLLLCIRSQSLSLMVPPQLWIRWTASEWALITDRSPMRAQLSQGSKRNAKAASVWLARMVSKTLSVIGPSSGLAPASKTLECHLISLRMAHSKFIINRTDKWRKSRAV